MSLSDAWYFSLGNRNNRQANVGNTVVVNRGNGIWCLGYIQDIEGDNVFIDMDCAQYAPSWIHSHHVWQHHLFSINKKPTSSSSLNIQVALRNEPHGPYIFRRAQLLLDCNEDNLYLSCIMDESGERQIVHRWQIVATLPEKEPLFFERLAEIPMIKHVVHCKKVNRIQAVDEYQISQLVDEAFRDGAGHWLADGDRFFVRTEQATVTFIFVGVFRCSVIPHRTSSARKLWPPSLDKVFQNYNQSGNASLTGLGYPLRVTMETSVEAGDKLHNFLSWDILSEIFRHLDFHSRLKAKGVCLSWSLALTAPASSFCVEIDFCNISHKKTSRLDTEGYVMACLLDRAVMHHTKTLVLTNLSQRVDPFPGMKLISSLLCSKGIQLKTIVINKCEVFAELYHSVEDTAYKQPMQLKLLMPACRRLVVSQYTVQRSLFCCSNIALPTIRSTRKVRYRRNPFPSMTISHMTFDCSPIDRLENNRRIIAALERHSDPVDDCVREHFREVHAQWILTLPYPDEWMPFKRVLQKYSRHFVHEEPVPADYWDLLDLRDFDRLPLNKFILQLLYRQCL